MLALGPISFLNPTLLAGLLLLPLAYFLIRAIPPSPRRLFFPATWLTRELDTQTADVDATPWWLVVLRLLLLALLIIALAHPMLTPQQRLPLNGPVVVLVDNDWSAAPDWPARRDAVLAFLESVGAQKRSALLATTAAPIEGWPENDQIVFASAELAREKMRALPPSPWEPDYAAALATLKPAMERQNTSVFYVTNGINHGAAATFLAELSALAPLDIAKMNDAALRQIAFASVKPSPDGFELLLIRPEETPPLAVSVVVKDANGATLARELATFAQGQSRADVSLVVAPQLRGRVSRLSVEGAQSAGATYLLDARARRPLVAVVDTPSATRNAPFQTPQFYLKRALAPYATVKRGTIQTLLNEGPAVVLLPDQGRLALETEADLVNWVKAGGVLVRFAGPAMLADNATLDDPLVPATLRSQPRIVGGTLSWSSALTLAPFDEESPFAGIIPAEDITIDRQVLARNGGLSQAQVWATLSDGTPLVSAATRGNGRLILFHTSADPQWSNLAISGTFVEMLQRLLHFSSASVAPPSNSAQTMSLTRFIGGRGGLATPPDTLAQRRYSQPLGKPVGPENPPGLYESPNARAAVNLASGAGPITPRTSLQSLQDAAGSLPIRTIEGALDKSLRPAVFAAVLALLMLDGIACLWLRGNIQKPRKLKTLLTRTAVTAIAFAFAQLSLTSADAAEPAQMAANVRLACLESGVPSIDTLCIDGLNGLMRQLNLRTSVWTGQAQLVSLEEDNLGLYPVVYWPLQSIQAPITTKQAANLNEYMRGGGMIIVDLGVGVKGQARMDTQLGPRDLLADLRSKVTFPPLSPLTKDHVLTHSFYIISRTPGRRGDGALWVEAGGEEQGAGVSPIILGNADWLSSWASVQTNLPGYAGGDRRRDELAVRFGINAVMYALTGTYKADQVHLPALLERVGRGE